MLTNQDFNKTIDNYNYNINDIIGQGSFSSVYKGKSILTGEKVAIKVINLSGLTADTYQKLQYELSILKNLPPHRNIVKMHKLLQTVNNVYIVTERCEHKLSKCENIDKVAVACGIIQGLKHLYINNIVHRDLKPDNILIKNGVPKIIDFGFAKTLNGPNEIMNQHLGTPLYMAPQMLDTKTYTSKCDIWSLGVTIHQLVYKCTPYKANNVQDLKRQIKSRKPAVFSLGISDPLTNLIKKCLTIDQTQRISWQQLFILSDQLKYSKTRPPSMQSLIQYGATQQNHYTSMGRAQTPMPQIPICYY